VIYGPIELFPFLGARAGAVPCLRYAGRSENGFTASIVSRLCWRGYSSKPAVFNALRGLLYDVDDGR
jgi:hypothetical protein